MSKRYLFSPVGNTDPIKYFSDGSMLHICRVYQPDIVYLYMSQEIYKCHLKDDRYVKTLHLLGDKLDHHFDIRLVIREELVDVQQYDFFYKDFRACIADIERQMDDGDQLLLNMASGTPAMKSALVVMATLAEYRFTPIQVSTPLHGSNLEHEERKEYDVETNWELDKDNKEDFHNRCEAVKCMNLFRLLKLDMLKKHLRAYDYHAAAAVSRELNPGLTQENQKLLDAAEARINLDWNTLVKLSVHKIRAFAPVSDTEKRKIFEYVLGLKIKLKKGEYADFVRAITPVVVDLMELCVNSCDYDAFKILDEKDRIVGIILGEKKPKKIMEVSYFIATKMRRKGYCKEAIYEFAKHIRENTKYKELMFCVRHKNKPSRAFIERKLRIRPEYMSKDFVYYKKKVSEFK